MFHEELEQAELGRAQADDLTAPRDLVGGGIERQIADGQCFTGQGRTDPAHDRVDPGDQFARGERLGDEIISPGFKAADLVILRPACSQHDDRDVGGFLGAAQTSADLDPAGAFDHPIEHDQIGRFFLRQQQRLIPVRGRSDGVTFTLETELQQLGEGWIVLYQ